MLDTNFGAMPFRPQVYDGNAHFKNLVFDFRVKTIRSSGGLEDWLGKDEKIFADRIQYSTTFYFLHNSTKLYILNCVRRGSSTCKK